MLPVISALLAFGASLVRSRLFLSLENVALRHQLAVYKQVISPFAVEKVPTLNLHGVLCGPEGKSYASLSQVVILWYALNSERG